MDRLHYVLGLLTLAGAVAAGWFLLSLLGEPDNAQRDAGEAEDKDSGQCVDYYVSAVDSSTSPLGS